MNPREKQQCLEFAQLLLGDSGRGTDIAILVDRCESLPVFRIALLLEFEASIVSIQRVVAKWRESLSRSDAGSDSSGLHFAAEMMALKQSELERALRDSTSEMLDKLKMIDTFTTQQAALRDELLVMGELISGIGKRAVTPDHFQERDSVDDNASMHTHELLVLKQGEIRQSLRDSTASLLDNLKALDALATTQSDLKANLVEVSDFLVRFQQKTPKIQAGVAELQGIQS